MARNNFNIGKMAELLGMSRRSFSLRLNRDREFNLVELNSMADLFGVTIDYLADRTEMRN